MSDAHLAEESNRQGPYKDDMSINKRDKLNAYIQANQDACGNEIGPLNFTKSLLWATSLLLLLYF